MLTRTRSDSPRRSPSGLHIALADRNAMLDPPAWDAVTKNRSWFFSREYLAMLEGVLPEGLEPRYALVSDGSMPLAAVLMQWVRLQGSKLRPQAATRDARRRR